MASKSFLLSNKIGPGGNEWNYQAQAADLTELFFEILFKIFKPKKNTQRQILIKHCKIIYIMTKI
jgi:hypothetical protein